MPFSFGEEPSHLGEYLQASCAVTHGDLPITITWLLNGALISSRNSAFTITNSKRSSILAIDSVADEHAGTYSCIGENKAGKYVHTADLIVNGLL